jgi:hypothetical protein
MITAGFVSAFKPDGNSHLELKRSYKSVRLNIPTALLKLLLNINELLHKSVSLASLSFISSFKPFEQL